MAVVKLLLGSVVGGRLVEPGICGVVAELVLIQVLLVGLCVLVKIVLIGIVPGLIELKALVMTLVGPLSTTEVEVSIFVGKAVVILVKLGKVAISVVEVNIDIGMVALEVISLLGPISMHGVVGEVGTIVTGIDSGHGTVEERTKDGVVLLIGTITEDVVGEVLEVSDKGILKALTEDSVFSLLEFDGEVGEDLVIEVTTECTLEEERVEDSVRVDIEEEIMVTKEEVSAVVEVLNIGKDGS